MKFLTAQTAGITWKFEGADDIRADPPTGFKQTFIFAFAYLLLRVYAKAWNCSGFMSAFAIEPVFALCTCSCAGRFVFVISKRSCGSRK